MTFIAGLLRRRPERLRGGFVPYTPVATQFEWVTSPANVTLASIGATASVVAKVTDQKHRPMAVQPTITYSSGTTAKITVSGNTLTAVANGTSVITAHAATGGWTDLTATATVAQVVASITGVSWTLSTDDASSGTFAPVGKDANNNTVSGATFSFATSNGSVITVTASTGAWVGQSAGSATITITSGSVTFTVSVTVTVSSTASYATPLVKDDMGYANQVALLANIKAAGGGTGGPGVLYSSIFNDPDVTLAVDDQSKALYNGLNTIRYDFNATSTRDTAANILHDFSPKVLRLWARLRVKCKNGFTTAGEAEGDNAQAYKLHEYTLNGTGAYNGSGRLELTNTNQYDNYFSVYTGSTPLATPNTPLGTAVAEWSDENWYDYTMLSTVSTDGKTRTTKWWKCIDGDTPVLISSVAGALSDGGDMPAIDSWVHGANFNQIRASTVTLWRGPWDAYDASVYSNPYAVPSGDISGVLSTLGSDASLAAPVVIPAAPGTPTAGNATSETETALTFPITLAATGGLPSGLKVRYSSDGGTTWSDGAIVAVLSPALGGSMSAQVSGLTSGTSYVAQFAENNAGGTSAWSSSASGSTALSDVFPVTSGLVLQLESTNTDVSTNNASVGTITDQSGTLLDVTQATSGAKPALITAATSTGLPIIRFASGTYLSAAAYNSALAATSQTIYVVFAASSSLSTDRVVFGNRSASTNGYAQVVSKASSADAPRFQLGTGSSFVSPGQAARSALLHSFCTTLTPSFCTTYVDGATVDGGGNGLIPNTTVAVAVGCDSATLGTLTGAFDLAAVYVFNRVLNATEQGQMNTYISAKWGTP